MTIDCAPEPGRRARIPASRHCCGTDFTVSHIGASVLRCLDASVLKCFGTRASVIWCSVLHCSARRCTVAPMHLSTHLRHLSTQAPTHLIDRSTHAPFRASIY